MARTTSVNTDAEDVLDLDDEFENPDLYEDEDVEEDDSEEEEDTSGGTEGSGQTVDWETRFKGLQASVQRKEETIQALHNRTLMAEAEAFKANLIAQDLEPADAQQRMQLWMAAKALELQQQKNSTDQAAVEDVARAVILQQLSVEFGIDPKSKTFERLSRMKDPEDMRAFAEEIATTKKTATKKTSKAVRKVTQADRFDSGASRGTPKPKAKAKSLDDAAAMFSKYKIEF